MLKTLKRDRVINKKRDVPRDTIHFALFVSQSPLFIIYFHRLHFSLFSIVYLAQPSVIRLGVCCPDPFALMK